MTSYLCILSSQPVFQNYSTHLANLVYLCFAVVLLQIDSFFNPRSSKDMVTATDALLKAKTTKQPAQFGEIDIGVRPAFQNLRQ